MTTLVTTPFEVEAVLGDSPEAWQEYARELQREYVKRRRAWCRKINWPLAGFEAEPPPGELDAEDPENG